MLAQTLPNLNLNDITTLLIVGFILLVGLIILIAVVKVLLHFFLAIVAGIIVWYISGSLLLGAIGFLAVAIITTTGRKKTVVVAGQPAGKICPRCGLSLAPNARYCPNCGASV